MMEPFGNFPARYPSTACRIGVEVKDLSALGRERLVPGSNYDGLHMLPRAIAVRERNLRALLRRGDRRTRSRQNRQRDDSHDSLLIALHFPLLDRTSWQRSSPIVPSAARRGNGFLTNWPFETAERRLRGTNVRGDSSNLRSWIRRGPLVNEIARLIKTSFRFGRIRRRMEGTRMSRLSLSYNPKLGEVLARLDRGRPLLHHSRLHDAALSQ